MKPRSVKIGIVVAALVLLFSLYWGSRKDKREGLSVSASTASGESAVKVLAASSWCGWSKKQASEFDAVKSSLSDVGVEAELIDDSTPEGEANMKKLAQENEVDGYPATLVVGGDGQVKGKISGYKPVDALVAEVKKLI